jgi:hypothetical protein
MLTPNDPLYWFYFELNKFPSLEVELSILHTTFENTFAYAGKTWKLEFAIKSAWVDVNVLREVGGKQRLQIFTLKHWNTSPNRLYKSTEFFIENHLELML